MAAPHRRTLGALSACLFAAACVAPQVGDAPRLQDSGAPSTLDREQARAHRQLGLGLEVAGEIAAAVDEFEAALALGSWPVAATTGGIADSPYGDLARICRRRDTAAEVVRACTRVIASLRFRSGRLAEFLANRADAFRRLGEPDRARSDYRSVLMVDANNPRGLLARGRARAGAGRHGAALIDFNRVVATTGPDRPEANYRPDRPEANYRPDRPEADYRPDWPEARYARALSLAALGDLEGAVADFDRVLSDPQGLAAHPGAYRGRAGVHCRLGQADAAAIGWQVWLDATQGGAAYVQEMLWAHGYLRGAVTDDFTPAALASLRAWTRAGCPGGAVINQL